MIFKRQVARRIGLALALSALSAGQARAGVLVSAAAKWGSFAARPLDSEPTPNYYGLGLGMNFGYSFSQVFDVTFFSHYLPAHLEASKLGAEGAHMFSYGGEIGLRFSQSVFLAIRAGSGRYKLIQEQQSDDLEEVAGSWQGPAGGFSVGAVHPLDKENFFQTSLDVLHAITVDNDNLVDGKRRFDLFTISVSYVFIGYKSRLMDNSIFSDFIDSVIFY